MARHCSRNAASAAGLHGPGAHRDPWPRCRATQRQDRSQGLAQRVRGLLFERTGMTSTREQHPHAPMDAVSRRRTTACRRRQVAFRDSRPQVGRTPFYAYDRGLITRVASSAQRISARGATALRDEGEPDARRSCSTSRPRRRARRRFRRRARGSRSTPACAAHRSASPDRARPTSELEQAVAAGIVVNLESEGEMERLAHREPPRRAAARRRARQSRLRAQDLRA